MASEILMSLTGERAVLRPGAVWGSGAMDQARSRNHIFAVPPPSIRQELQALCVDDELPCPSPWRPRSIKVESTPPPAERPAHVVLYEEQIQMFLGPTDEENEIASPDEDDMLG